MKINIGKKCVVLFMSVIVVLTALPFSADQAYGWVSYGQSGITGKVCTKDAYASSTIDYLLLKYPQYAKWTGGGQCYGYAEKIGKILGSSRKITYYKSLKFNKKNFRKLCLNLKAGAHLRLSKYKTFNGWYGHSIVLLKVTDKKVIWTDNNGASDDRVRYYSGTLDEFVNSYGYKYLNAITKVTRYSKPSMTSLASTVKTDSSIKLSWRKTSNTKKYYVYRATSKNGKYKKIKTTTARNYTYKSAPIGKQCYYKVKPVKSGRTVYSNVTSRTRKLRTPSTKVSTNPATGNIGISWKKVPSATGYAIYRSSNFSGKYTKIKTTKSLSYTDAKARNVNKYYVYKVKALYSKNSKGNSKYSSERGTSPKFARPTLTKITTDPSKVNLSWNAVSGASKYNVYKSTDGKNYYFESTVKEGTTYVDEYTSYGTQYYYKVTAGSTSSWGAGQSEMSNAVSVIPLDPNPSIL